MKAKDWIVLMVLGGAGVLAYFLLGRNKAPAQPATATTGTAGIGQLLFGQPKNGAPTTLNAAAYGNAAAKFVNDISALFTGNNGTNMSTQTPSVTLTPADLTIHGGPNDGTEYVGPDQTFPIGSDPNTAALKKKKFSKR